MGAAPPQGVFPLVAGFFELRPRSALTHIDTALRREVPALSVTPSVLPPVRFGRLQRRRQDRRRYRRRM